MNTKLKEMKFKVKDISGPDHLRTFEILVKIGRARYKSSVDTNKKSAEQGLAEAQTNLGWMYEFGKGVEQDYLEAI